MEGCQEVAVTQSMQARREMGLGADTHHASTLHKALLAAVPLLGYCFEPDASAQAVLS